MGILAGLFAAVGAVAKAPLDAADQLNQGPGAIPLVGMLTNSLRGGIDAVQMGADKADNFIGNGGVQNSMASMSNTLGSAWSDAVSLMGRVNVAMNGETVQTGMGASEPPLGRSAIQPAAVQHATPIHEALHLDNGTHVTPLFGSAMGLDTGTVGLGSR